MSQPDRLHRIKERADRPYSCGGCGQRFSTKGAKHRHKEECDLEAFDYPPPVVSPELKARAAAEWAAMPLEMTAVQYARAHGAALSPERRAELEKEWAE